jgi:cytochrome c553
MQMPGLKTLRRLRVAGWAAALLLLAPAAQADPADATPSPIGYGSRGYQWNGMTPEQVEVLKLTGDTTRGKDAFRGCQGCHRREGVGRPDGTYPRLAGQHAVVIVKQVTDTRAGVRRNPKMDPFASDHAVSLQEIADIAAYLSTLRGPVEVGLGPADIAPTGATLYTKLGCADCHGAAGEGKDTKIYPVVAGQHYPYLLREMEHVRDGQRGNSHPDMVKALKGQTTADLQALASFMSRLPTPPAAPR